MPFFREVLPHAVITPAGLVHFLERHPERAAMRAWAADLNGEIVGFADARLRWAIAAEGIGAMWLGVLPAHRHRGLGTRFYELATAHLMSHRAHQVESFYREGDEAGRAFAARLGFEDGRLDQIWTLEVPPDFPEPEARPETRVVRLRDVRNREHDLFDLYRAAEQDMPDDHPRELVFEEWLTVTLGDPELDFERSAVVLVNDRPASFAWLITDFDGERAMNQMTGTAPEFRRRGLARLAKEATIHWAAEAGIRKILSSNDTTNADMLALNEHLGYRPTERHVSVTKLLDRGEPGP